MDLELSADQELFAETTRRFLEATCPIVEVRRLHDAGGGFDPGYWRQGAELGWTATLVAEADGGGSVSGDGLLDLVLVAEEMGRLVSPGPLVPVNVVADAVSRRGSAEQRAAVLPGLVSGEQVATWAFAEESATWDAAGVALALRPSRATAGRSPAPRPSSQDAGGRRHVPRHRTHGRRPHAVPRACGHRPASASTPLGSLDFTRTFGRVDFDGAHGAGARRCSARWATPATTSNDSCRSRSRCRTRRRSARPRRCSTSPSSTPRTASRSVARSARTRR